MRPSAVGGDSEPRYSVVSTHRVQRAEQQDALHGVTETGALLVRLGEHRLRTEIVRVSGIACAPHSVLFKIVSRG